MSGGRVHFELFIRRGPADGWVLRGAGEDRAELAAEAQALVDSGRVVGARVVKEVLDEESGLFSSVAVLTLGAAEPARKKTVTADEAGPPCSTPADLYTPHAREKIGRVLEEWLRRRGVTAFELLHSPALAEALDGGGADLQGAVQRIAIPDSQASGRPLHDSLRHFQALAERAIARVVADGRRAAFPEVDPSTFAVAAGRLCGAADAGYLLGGGVAAHLASAQGWRGRFERLVALAEAAPDVGPGRALALRVLEPPLGEILGGRAGLNELAGGPVDTGGGLALLVRLAASREAAAVETVDPTLMQPLPALTGLAARLQRLLELEAFELVRAATLRRILAELNGPRRLKPTDPEGEIALLRALAGVLGAAAGPRLPLDDVRAAFVERSRRLVAADFVEALIADRAGPLAEARALFKLAENVTGAANRRAAARWLEASLGSLRFESAIRQGPDPPGAKLAALADLQAAVRCAELDPADVALICTRLGEAGGWVEAQAHLAAQLARSDAPPTTRALVLLRMAVGETAPRGPAADRARAEAVKLLRTPDLQADAAAHPDSAARLRHLAAQLAA